MSDCLALNYGAVKSLNDYIVVRRQILYKTIEREADVNTIFHIQGQLDELTKLEAQIELARRHGDQQL